MSSFPHTEPTSPSTQRWVVPVVMCLAGAGWLSHAEPGPGYTLAAVAAVGVAALSILGAALPRGQRGQLYAALMIVVCVLPAVLAAPALLSPGANETTRMWARVDQLVALGAMVASAQVALRRKGDRNKVAFATLFGAVALGALATDQLGWAAAGLLIAGGATAPLLFSDPPARQLEVGHLRPARGNNTFIINDIARSMFGIAAQGDLSAEAICAAVAPTSRAPVRAALEDSLRGLPVNLDLEVIDEQGRVRHLLLDGLSGELQLRALEQTSVARRARGADRAELAASLGNMGILVVNREGEVLESNDVMERLSAPWDGPGRWWAELRQVQERSRRSGRTEPTDQVRTAEQLELSPPGTDERCVLQVRQRHLGGGELLVIAEDVAGAVEAAEARQRAQAGLIRELDALRERQVSTQAFLARFNHEIRTPLNVIKGFSELMLDYTTEAQAREDIERIHAHAISLEELLAAVTEYGWIESGQLSLERAPFDLSGVLDEVTHAVHGRMLARGNSLRVTYPRDNLRMIGDRARLVQVLENLLDNAARFTSQGSVQLVAGPGDGDSVDFMVRDSGIGMSAEQVSQLGQPFWQGAQLGAHRSGSVGLGFTIVKGLVARMGGQLQVESHPGQGTMITINVPREPRAVAPAARPRPTAKGPTEAAPAGAVDLAEVRRRAQELDDHDTLVSPGRSVLVQGIAPRPPTLAGDPSQRKGSG